MKTTDLTVTRTIRAAPKEVFDVWMDPKSPGGPWHGASKLIIDPVVDGLFYVMVEHEGRRWPHYGRFTRIEKAKLSEYTWMSESTRGLETIVTVTFAAKGDATEVMLRHTGVPDDDEGRKHAEGWGWVLDMLSKQFE